MRWNNTGVHKDFACAKGIVHTPAKKQSILDSNNWSIYSISNGVFLGAYSKKGVALLVILKATSGIEALQVILRNNPDTKKYAAQFTHPNGNVLHYDLNAPKNKWVIKSINGIEQERDFEKWPFFDGSIDL